MTRKQVFLGYFLSAFCLFLSHLETVRATPVSPTAFQYFSLRVQSQDMVSEAVHSELSKELATGGFTDVLTGPCERLLMTEIPAERALRESIRISRQNPDGTTTYFDQNEDQYPELMIPLTFNRAALAMDSLVPSGSVSDADQAQFARKFFVYRLSRYLTACAITGTAPEEKIFKSELGQKLVGTLWRWVTQRAHMSIKPKSIDAFRVLYGGFFTNQRSAEEFLREVIKNEAFQQTHSEIQLIAFERLVDRALDTSNGRVIDEQVITGLTDYVSAVLSNLQNPTQQAALRLRENRARVLFQN